MSDTLAKRQAAFLDAILDDGAQLPDGWGNSQAAGMAVYRGNYRSALIGALESTYERTRRYVGEGAFKQAAINHAIAHPPSGWTIEDTGAGFEETSAAYFKNNPEVADLAWLEWAMLQAANAPDITPLSPEQFGEEANAFGDEDWMMLRLQFQPRMAIRDVTTNLGGLWNALEEDAALVRPDPILETPRGCIVSREGELPIFQMVATDNAAALSAMAGGASYGEIIMRLAGDDPDDEAIQNAAMRAGALVGEWLKDGLIIALNP